MSLSNSEIPTYFEQLDNEIKELKLSITRMCWYMRGGLSYNEAYQVAPQDREIIYKLIEENMENVKKTKLPLL